MRKHLVLVILSLFIEFTANSQYFDLFNVQIVDSSKLIFKANYFYIDTVFFKPIDLDIERIKLSIDGYPMEVVDYKPVKVKDFITSPPLIVFVIDISGSMLFNGGLEMVKSIVSIFIDFLPDNVRIALVVFNNKAYKLVSFTHNKEIFKEVVNSLFAFDGTDFMPPLYTSEHSSAYALLKDISYTDNKLIVFLTDGYGYFDKSTLDTLITKFRAKNIKLFSLGLFTFLPESMDTLSEKTGGFAIKMAFDARKLFNFYFNVLLNLKFDFGTIYFKPKLDSCVVKKFSMPNLTLDYDSLHFSSKLPLSFSIENKVKLFNYIFELAFLPNGYEVERELKFSSNFVQRLNKVYITDTVHFELLAIPRVSEIQPQRTYSVRFKYRSSGENIHIEYLVLDFDKCGEIKVPILVGKMDKTLPTSLEVLSPNGGEEFYVSQDLPIKWTGVPINDSVEIYISFDGGENYFKVGSGANLNATIDSKRLRTTKCAKVKLLHRFGVYIHNTSKLPANARNVSFFKDYTVVFSLGNNVIRYNYLLNKFDTCFTAKKIIKRIVTLRDYIVVQTLKELYVLDGQCNLLTRKRISKTSYIFPIDSLAIGFKVPKVLNILSVPDLKLQGKYELQDWHLVKGKLLGDSLIVYSPRKAYLIYNDRVIKYSDKNVSRIYGIIDRKLLYRVGNKLLLGDDELMRIPMRVRQVKILGTKVYFLDRRNLVIKDLESGEQKKLQFKDYFFDFYSFNNGFRIVLLNNSKILTLGYYANIFQSDESDDCFEIKPVKVEALPELYMPLTYVDNSVNKVFFNLIRTEENVELPILNYDIELSPTSDNRQYKPAFYAYNFLPLEYLNSGNFFIEISYIPKEAGTDTAYLYIWLPDTVVKIKVIAKAIEPKFNMLLKDGDYSLGRVRLDTFKIVEIPVLVNTMAFEGLRISKIFMLGDYEVFEIIEPTENIMLSLYDTLKLKVKFKGNNLGWHNALVRIVVGDIQMPIFVSLEGFVFSYNKVVYNFDFYDLFTRLPLKGVVATIELKREYYNKTFEKSFGKIKIKVNTPYKVVFRYPGYLPVELRIKVKKNPSLYNYYQQVWLVPEFRDTVPIYTFHFDVGSIELWNSEKQSFKYLILALKQNSQLKVLLEGHTDDSGEAENNYNLSIKRAEAIKDFLIKAGIDEDRIIVRGYGETRPLVPNTSKINRQRNRRVEVKLFM